MSVKIPLVNISTKRSLNQAPFGKINKSGDGGGSGGSFRNKRDDGYRKIRVLIKRMVQEYHTYSFF
jgi:hypothetical protein